MWVKRTLVRILLQSIFFIVLIFISDRFIGSGLQTLYYKQKTGPNKMLTYSLTTCNEDILVFGNSRAQHHYDPQILTNTLKMSCFNAGQDGGHSILLPYAQILAILQRYKPKFIIVEFSPSSIYYDETDYDKLAILNPYYDSLEILRPIIELRSPFEKIKLISDIYPYNSQLINIVRFDIKEDNKTITDEGFSPIRRTLNCTELQLNEISKVVDKKVDNNKTRAINKIIELCNRANVNLIFINSPIYKYRDFYNYVDQKMIWKNELGLPDSLFWDYSSDSRFIDSCNYFSDPKHLNNFGARLYTKIISERISIGIKFTINH